MLTFVAAVGAAALAGNGILNARRRYRPRRAWEPSIPESFRCRKTNWKLVGHKTIKVSQIESIVAAKGLYGLDGFMWEEFGRDGDKWGPGDWRCWSINWRHGCLNGDGTSFMEPCWAETADGEAIVFFYHMPIDNIPKPKPDPVPEPEIEPVNLWTPADELRNVLSYLRSPSAFWLAPEGKVPTLRFYENGDIVVCENGASVEGFHADLTFKPTKKLRYIITTEGNGEEWKQRRFRTMEAAENAIEEYFARMRSKRAAQKKVIDRLRPKVAAISSKKNTVSPQFSGSVYTVFDPEGVQHIYYTLREAIEFLRELGYSERHINEMVSAGSRHTGSFSIAKQETPFEEFKALADLNEFGKATIRFTEHDEKSGRVDGFLRDKHVTAWHVEDNGDTTYHFTSRPKLPKTDDIHEMAYRILAR